MKKIPRPEHMLPTVPLMPTSTFDPKRFHHGFEYLEKRLKFLEAENKRMIELIWTMKQKLEGNSMDGESEKS